eukprot:1394678-Amorphochlora_amoeboformis.AAC.1
MKDAKGIVFAYNATVSSNGMDATVRISEDHPGYDGLFNPQHHAIHATDANGRPVNTSTPIKILNTMIYTGKVVITRFSRWLLSRIQPGTPFHPERTW